MMSNLLLELKKDPVRQQLVSHSFLNKMRNEPFNDFQATEILSQWYHPLHHFPVFLSELISILPSLEMQTFISKILWQELGEGDPKMAHEDIYIQSMEDLGFEKEHFVDCSPNFVTRKLVEGYKESIKKGYLHSLGFVFGTEVADLAMVSAIGSCIKKLKNVKKVEWIDIHVLQEPDHVDSVDNTLAMNYSGEEKEKIFDGAIEMWKLWINFFSQLEKNLVSGVNTGWKPQKLAV